LSLVPSGGSGQKTAAAVARRVVGDEQEDAVEDDEVVREEDLSDEEADSAGPVASGVGGAGVGGAGERQGRVVSGGVLLRGGLKSLRVNEYE
jgi:hypothetical protein